MESVPIYKRAHPMVPIAAASVIVMSLIGIGVFTGVIPTHMNSQAESPTMVAGASSTAPEPVPGPAPADGYPPPPPFPNQANQPYPPAPAPASVAAAPVPEPAPAIDCYACGHVEYVQTVETLGRPTGVGAVAGGIGGALIGNQLGHRSSRGPLTILGAVGGAFAGNAIEKHVHKQVGYRVHVRMDDGTVRTFSAASSGAYAAGERVRVENNGLVPIG